MRVLVFCSVALSCWMSRSSLRTFWRTRALHLRFWGRVRGGWGVEGMGKGKYLFLGCGLPQETSDGLHGGRSMGCALRLNCLMPYRGDVCASGCG